MTTDWMLNDKDPARQEIVERAKKLGITGNPEQAAHELGDITLQDGRTVKAFVVHAVDPVITDGTEVVLINRRFPPGKSLPALPGGMIDPTLGGGVESAIEAAAREAMEEVGVDLATAKATPVGTRNMNRPFDVRVATSDKMFKKYGIRKGDIFMVSTQAVRFDVADLKQTKLEAGDDAEAGTARRVDIASLTKETMGIPDHFDMIASTFPHKFVKSAPSKAKFIPIALAFAFFILTLNAAASYSYETPMTSVPDKQLIGRFGQAFQETADKFGCTELAWGNMPIPGKIATLEYVPQGDNVGAWTRLMTVTVYAISGDPESDQQLMNKIMGGTIDNYKKNATIINSEFFKMNSKDPGMFVEYKIGQGALEEHNAGIFMRTSDKSAAFIQIQSRGKPLDPKDAQMIKALLRG